MVKYNTEFNMPQKLDNRELLKILQFYLFECPVEGTSHRGKKFKELGYSGSRAFGALKKELLRTATPSLAHNFKPSTREEIKANLESVENISYPDEYCVYLKNSKSGIIQSMFSAIRNSFAHGSFNVRSYSHTRIFYLSNYKDYEKARMILHEKTLLRWIEIIKGE